VVFEVALMTTIAAVFVMFFLPLLLAWIPVPGLGGLVAGLIGGYLIGRPGRAFTIALLPFVLLAVVIVLLAIGVGAGSGASWLGALGTAFAGLAVIWLIAHNIAMLFGAIVGGLLHEWWDRQPPSSPPEWPEGSGQPSA